MSNSSIPAQRQALAHAGENPAPETDASGVLSEASCCASSDFISQTSENGNSSPDMNPSDASRECQPSQVQATRRTLLHFVGCPELWRSLGGSDISHRLKYAILRWLELDAPDPVFGRAAGLWVDWVPLFEDWLVSIPAQRQSAPTGAQNSDCKQEADRPLGGAACCASDSGITGSAGETPRSGGEQQKSESGSLRPDSPTSDQCSPELSAPRTLGELRRRLSSFHEVSSGGVA